MTLPIDVMFVRHGQSEGNLAKRLSEKGDHEAHKRAHVGRHTRSMRLTALGREQAVAVSRWLTAEGGHFDRCVVSEYARAMETAALLSIPRAEWYRTPELTERSWGEVDGCTEQERAERFGEALRMRDVEPFFWAPLSGESFLDLCIRLRTVLDTLHRECADKRVIIVCHGEVMWAFRVLIERMSQQRFKELHLSQDPIDRLHNCEVLHYSRRNPDTQQLDAHANWMRRVRPAEDNWTTGWQPVERRRYSNRELLEIVRDEYPAVLE